MSILVTLLFFIFLAYNIIRRCDDWFNGQSMAIFYKIYFSSCAMWYLTWQPPLKALRDQRV